MKIILMYTYYLILFIICAGPSFGQTKKHKAAKTSKKDRVAPCYQSKDPIVKGDCFYDLGQEFLAYKQYQYALNNFNSALQYYPEKVFTKRAKTHEAIAKTQKGLNNYEEANLNLEQAIKLYRYAKDKKAETRVLEDLADNQIKLNDNKEALNTLEKVLQNNQTEGNKAGEIRAQTKIQEISREDIVIKEETEYLEEVVISVDSTFTPEPPTNLNSTSSRVSIYDEDDILEYANEELEEEDFEEEELIETYDAVEKYYSSRGNSAKALEAKRKSFEIASKSKQPVAAEKSLELASSYASNSQTSEAIEQLNYTIALADSLEDLETKVEAYKSVIAISDKDEETNQDSLIIFYQQLVAFQDSLNKQNLINAKSSTELLNTQKQEQLLLQQNEIIGIQADEIRLQKWLSVAIATILVGTIILLWFIFRNHQKEKKNNYTLGLRALRSQMNPHFIFNALNSINEFIANNDERKANRFLSSFSKLMRSVMQNNESDFIQLSQEIQILKEYLTLEHYRFSEKFEYNFEIDQAIDAEALMIPPMIIQPYIENAIWHGLRYKEEKGELNINFKAEDQLLVVTISDDGIGRQASQESKTKNQKEHKSTAMQNINERVTILHKLHGYKFNISVTDLSPGTQVKFSLSLIN